MFRRRFEQPPPDQRISMSAIVCVMGAILFCLFAGIMLPWLLWREHREQEMLTWPSVTGSIVSARIDGRYPKAGSIRFVHELTYSYIIEKKSFVGNRSYYGRSTPGWDSPAQARKSLPAPGEKIDIHYNPKDPSDCVLHVLPTPASDRKLLHGFAGGLGFGGCLTMLIAGYAWRKERK